MDQVSWDFVGKMNKMWKERPEKKDKFDLISHLRG